jgi:hypothetical protein
VLQKKCVFLAKFFLKAAGKIARERHDVRADAAHGGG